MANDVIKVGDYIIVQKHNYKKIHKFNKPNSSLSLGRDSIDLSGIDGCKLYSTFKMIPKSSKKNKEYTLELTEEVIGLEDEIDIKGSGMDNRNIIDDGCSQKLSAAEIKDLQNDASKASDIVETLITNSKTFHNKTEYSQQKYLRKKEKKYFEYLQILKPNLRMIADIMYRLEPTKIQGIRVDTLSQMITMANVYSEGVHLLYDSGSNGLVAAAMLNAIGANTSSKLIHMHPGNMSQKQALLALNFPEEQLNRCISVNVYSVLRQYFQGCDTNDKDKNMESNLKRPASDIVEHSNKVAKLEEDLSVSSDHKVSEDPALPEPKKPKWHFENIAAWDLLQTKVDSLTIACKEDPYNILKELVQFVKPSRPFVVYYPVAEPLQQMFVTLRPQSNIAALKLSCNWMRSYQVLPERTHPEVNMNNAGGFLLTGYVLK